MYVVYREDAAHFVIFSGFRYLFDIIPASCALDRNIIPNIYKITRMFNCYDNRGHRMRKQYCSSYLTTHLFWSSIKHTLNYLITCEQAQNLIVFLQILSDYLIVYNMKDPCFEKVAKQRLCVFASHIELSRGVRSILYLPCCDRLVDIPIQIYVLQVLLLQLSRNRTEWNHDIAL